MEKIFHLLLYFHIVAGAISLGLGLIILVLAKGSPLHKRLGSIFYYAMMVNAIVALPLSFIHPNTFLRSIALFTCYFLLSGVRYLHKRKHASFSLVDYSISLMAALVVIFMFYNGIASVIRGNMFGILFLVFGTILLRYIYTDYRLMTSAKAPIYMFVVQHLQRMISSYIATVTAFVVVNEPPVPPLVAWLLPSVCLVPLIILWSRKYTITK